MAYYGAGGFAAPRGGQYAGGGAFGDPYAAVPQGVPQGVPPGPRGGDAYYGAGDEYPVDDDGAYLEDEDSEDDDGYDDRSRRSHRSHHHHHHGRSRSRSRSRSSSRHRSHHSRRDDPGVPAATVAAAPTAEQLAREHVSVREEVRQQQVRAAEEQAQREFARAEEQRAAAAAAAAAAMAAAAAQPPQQQQQQPPQQPPQQQQQQQPLFAVPPAVQPKKAVSRRECVPPLPAGPQTTPLHEQHLLPQPRMPQPQPQMPQPQVSQRPRPDVGALDVTTRDLAALTAQAQGEVDAVRAALPALEQQLAAARTRLAAAEAAVQHADAEHARLRLLVGGRDLAREFAALDDAPDGMRVRARGGAARAGAGGGTMSTREGFGRQQRLHQHYSAQIAQLRREQGTVTRTQLPLVVFMGLLVAVLVWGVLTLLFP